MMLRSAVAFVLKETDAFEQSRLHPPDNYPAYGLDWQSSVIASIKSISRILSARIQNYIVRSQFVK